MPESIGQFFPTQVPSYTEAADIRKAFNLYHYGTEEIPSTEEAILSSSMAGYIRDTLQAVADANIGATVVIALGPTDDLDLLEISGSYKSTATPNVADLHYPSISPGILNVWITADSTYFQTYLSTLDNGSWWRTGTKPQATVIWSAWGKSAVENHTHDTRYYTISQINAKLTASPTISTVPVYNATGQIISSAVTATQLGYLNSLTSNVQTQITAKASSTHLHDDRYYLKSSVTDPTAEGEDTARIFVKDPSTGSPFGAATGDLWFW